MLYADLLDLCPNIYGYYCVYRLIASELNRRPLSSNLWQLTVLFEGEGIHLVGFQPSFTRETHFVTSSCFLAHQDTSEKGSTLNGNNLFPSLF